MKLKTNLLLILLFIFSFGAQAQTYTFEYNIKKGDSFTQTIVSNIKMIQEMMGQEMEIITQATIKNTYKVNEIKNELITIDMVYNSIETVQEMMGQKMLMGSESSLSDPMFGEVNTMFKSLTQTPISITINKKGEVKEIKGIEKLQQAMMESIKDPNNTIITQVSQQFIGEEAIKNSFEQAMNIFFPEKAVIIGDSWEKSLFINQSQINIDAIMKITLLSVTNNVATLKVETILGSESKSYSVEINGMNVNMVMNGTQTGTIKIDLNTGWLKESDISQYIISESEVNDMKIPQTLTGTTKTIMEKI